MRTSPMKRRIKEVLSAGREAAQIGLSREAPPEIRRSQRQGRTARPRPTVASAGRMAPAGLSTGTPPTVVLALRVVRERIGEAARSRPSREAPPVTERPGRRGEAQPRRAMV